MDGASIVQPSQVVVLQCGLRHFTVTVTIESDDFPAAITTAERLRVRLARRSTFDALNVIGCAHRDVGTTRNISAKNWNGRAVDAVMIEWFLTYAVNEVDTVGEGPDFDGNWIQTVDTPTGTFS